MRVKDLMRRDIASVARDATLEEVVRLLAASGISGIPVVSSDGKLMGIVTEHDVIKVIVPSYELHKGDESSRLDFDFLLAARADQVRSKPVSDIMSRDVIALAEDDPVIKATSTMLLKKLKVLPVVSAGEVVGMVSRIDIALALLRADGEDGPGTA